MGLAAVQIRCICAGGSSGQQKLAWEHCQDKVGMQAKHSAALMQPTYCLTFA